MTHLAAAGDYMLSAEAMQRLQATFGALTVDAFASGATALLPRFWSGEAVAGNLHTRAHGPGGARDSSGFCTCPVGRHTQSSCRCCSTLAPRCAVTR